jgi:hypothetical protein
MRACRLSRASCWPRASGRPARGALTICATRFDPETLAPSGALLKAFRLKPRRDAVSAVARRLRAISTPPRA